MAPAMPHVQSVSKPLFRANIVAFSRFKLLPSNDMIVMPMFSNMFVQSGWP